MFGAVHQIPCLVIDDAGRIAQMRLDSPTSAHTDDLGRPVLRARREVRQDGDTYAFDLDGTLYAAFMDTYVELGFPMPVIHSRTRASTRRDGGLRLEQR